MGGTRDFLVGMGAPVDGDDPAFWDEVFGTDREPPAPPTRRYSTAKAPGTGPFRSWKDFIARTSEAERMRWCALKAKKANGWIPRPGEPKTLITAREVWNILESAQGRCRYCGSLAVEKKPPSGPWGEMGRRIGSLDHVKARFDGGNSAAQNLGWACNWCNTWKSERRKGARDHGGFYPVASVPRARRAPAKARRSRK